MASCPQPNQNTKEKGQSLESAKLEELVTACLCFSQTAPILWGGGVNNSFQTWSTRKGGKGARSPVVCRQVQVCPPFKIAFKAKFLTLALFQKKIV